MMYPNDIHTVSTASSSNSSAIHVELLIEQQVKLTRLQQLQQLQNQIFQQQIALISGHPPTLLHDPTHDLSILRDSTLQMNGLPTPGGFHSLNFFRPFLNLHFSIQVHLQSSVPSPAQIMSPRWPFITL